MARLHPRYKHSSKRLLLLNFEGDMWIRDMSRAGLLAPFELQQGITALLDRFAEDSRNEVWLLSGLPVKDVLHKIAAAVPGVGMVAENRCFIKAREMLKTPATWIDMVADLNFTWKGPSWRSSTTYVHRIGLPLMLNLFVLEFAERTLGSFVEEREASIVWCLWTGPTNDCPDRQWARRQAAEAQNNIFDTLGERYGLRIIPGANSFLVLPNNISRSTVVGAILHPGGPTQSPRSGIAGTISGCTSVSGAGTGSGMVNGVGDWGGGEDVLHGHDEAVAVFALSGDEKLLRRLNELDHAETISTSRKGTDAKWKLDPKDVMDVLSQLAGV